MIGRVTLYSAFTGGVIIWGSWLYVGVLCRGLSFYCLPEEAQGLSPLFHGRLTQILVYQDQSLSPRVGQHQFEFQNLYFTSLFNFSSKFPLPFCEFSYDVKWIFAILYNIQRCIVAGGFKLWSSSVVKADFFLKILKIWQHKACVTAGLQ